MNLAEKEEVANDKEESYQFTITLAEARRFGMPSSGILEMIFANRAKIYPVIKQNRAQWRRLTGYSKDSLRVAISNFKKQGIIEEVVLEDGEVAYKYLLSKHRSTVNGSLQNVNGSLQNVNGSLQNVNGQKRPVNGSLTQSVMENYGNVNGSLHCTIYPKILSKELEDKELLREEGLTPQVASLPRPSASDSFSDFSSEVISKTETTTEGAGLSKTETVEVAETKIGNLQAMVAEAVKAELEKSALSHPPTITGSETRTAPQQWQEGAKMETTEASVPVVSKPKAVKAARPPILTKIEQFDLAFPEQHRDVEVKKALQDFVDYRIRIKHPATPRAINMILKEFVNDSPKTLIEALEYTMASETGNPNSKKGNWIQVVRPKNSVSSGGQPRDLHAEMEELLSMEG